MDVTSAFVVIYLVIDIGTTGCFSFINDGVVVSVVYEEQTAWFEQLVEILYGQLVTSL